MKRSERKRYFVECGLKRKQYRMQIRGALLHNGYMEADIARQLGVTSQVVCMVVGGALHSPKVLQALREAGVPEKYLFDPRTLDPRKFDNALGSLPIGTIACHYGVDRATVLRWAKRENWVYIPRAKKLGGNKWLISSMPEHRRAFLCGENGHAV